MNRMLAIFLALSLGANVGLVLRVLDASPASEHPRPPHKGGKPSLDRTLDHHLERLSADLALRAEQQAVLREAHGVLFPSIRQTHQAIEQQRDAVARAFAEEVGTPDAFRARVQGLQQTQALLDSLLTEVLLAEVAVLDPDQRRGVQLPRLLRADGRGIRHGGFRRRRRRDPQHRHQLPARPRDWRVPQQWQPQYH